MNVAALSPSTSSGAHVIVTLRTVSLPNSLSNGRAAALHLLVTDRMLKNVGLTASLRITPARSWRWGKEGTPKQPGKSFRGWRRRQKRGSFFPSMMENYGETAGQGIILVVEDNEDDVFMTKRMLKSAGVVLPVKAVED